MTANPSSELNSTLSISPPPDRRVFSKKFLIESSVVVGASPFNSMVRDSSISSWSVCSAVGTPTLTAREAPSKQCCRRCNTVFRTKVKKSKDWLLDFFFTFRWRIRNVYHTKFNRSLLSTFTFQHGEILNGSDSVRLCGFKKKG